jgi:hypothetical protein
MFAGIGVMGGAMLRDFAIVSTVFGASLSEVKQTGVRASLDYLSEFSFSFSVEFLLLYHLDTVTRWL